MEYQKNCQIIKKNHFCCFVLQINHFFNVTNEVITDLPHLVDTLF